MNKVYIFVNNILDNRTQGERMEKIINLEIKKGINLHVIKTNKFKTNLLSVFLSTPLEK